MIDGHYTIGIDCRLSGSTHAGIGRYIENLITRLPLNQPKLRWVLFFYHRSQIPQDTAFKAAIELGSVKVVFAPIKHYSLAEQIKLPTIFGQNQLDLLHVPHFNLPLFLPSSLPIVLTIHDLLWHEYKGTTVTTLSPWKYWLKYIGYRFVTQLAISKAKAILVPSNAVKQTIHHHFPQVSDRVIVTYEGATAETPVSKFDKLVAHKIETKTLLYVGSLYPHKNVIIILKALQKLPDYKLEIAGSRSVFRDAVADQAVELGVTDQVQFLGFVPDDQLSQKYKTCLALVQPSLSEGFGLTGLEAMTAGGAVIASDIPVFKEIYQGGASYFNPHSVDSFIAAVNKVAGDKRYQLIQAGVDIAAQYSWQTMVDQTVQTYLRVLTNDKTT